MFFDELDKIAQLEKRNPRDEEKSLIPVDSCSQLDTGYTGRPDTDVLDQEQRIQSSVKEIYKSKRKGQ